MVFPHLTLFQCYLLAGAFTFLFDIEERKRKIQARNNRILISYFLKLHPMKVTRIPLLNTGYFSGLTKEYISEQNHLKNFYNINFSIKNFAKAIEERKKFDTDRGVLYEVLNKQHALFYKEFPALANTVGLVKEANTFTITTGHQICLATGPLYFIYKIATAINLSRKLKLNYPAYNFVPIYWMATEDHDFEEINHIHLFNKKITWNKEVQGATGRISTEDIAVFLNEIKEILGDKINTSSFYDIIVNAYQHGSNLTEATRAMVLNLFANEGLLVIDADDKILKQSFNSIIKKDITESISYKGVMQTIDDLVQTNMIKEEKIQVKPREINFFYLTNELRKRIVLEQNTYRVLDSDISFSETELLNEIDQFPERFSPNVIMRPVYQEYILPNLCYIGGAGELSYWFELKATFDAHAVFYPILALRNSFLWLDQKQSEKLTQLGFSVSDIFKHVEDLTALYLKRSGVEDVSFDDDIALSNVLFEKVKAKVTAIESTLGATVESERQKLLKSIEVLAQKTIKAQKQKHEIAINQIKKLKENLFPEGGLQERYENLLQFNLKFTAITISYIIEMADPEINDLQIFSE